MVEFRPQIVARTPEFIRVTFPPVQYWLPPTVDLDTVAAGQFVLPLRAPLTPPAVWILPPMPAGIGVRVRHSFVCSIALKNALGTAPLEIKLRNQPRFFSIAQSVGLPSIEFDGAPLGFTMFYQTPDSQYQWLEAKQLQKISIPQEVFYVGQMNAADFAPNALFVPDPGPVHRVEGTYLMQADIFLPEK